MDSIPARKRSRAFLSFGLVITSRALGATISSVATVKRLFETSRVFTIVFSLTHNSSHRPVLFHPLRPSLDQSRMVVRRSHFLLVSGGWFWRFDRELCRDQRGHAALRLPALSGPALFRSSFYGMWRHRLNPDLGRPPSNVHAPVCRHFSRDS